MIAALLLAAGLQNAASASPSPSPAASPRATASSRFSMTVSGSNVWVDQATVGPGVVPPEGAGFARGSPISPMSPYDWFSGAPVTPGIAGIAQYALSGSYRAAHVTVETTLGIAGLGGSTTNAAYWGEPLLANLDPHALARRVPYAILFPTHAGADDANVGAADFLEASVADNDGRWRVRGGYFDLAQTDRFVFAPPPLTNATPSLGEQTAETVGPGMPSIAAWAASPQALPLLGIDAFAKRNGASFELTDALLPAPAGTSARLTMGSVVVDRGEAGRFSFQIAHVQTSGDPILTTTLFGADPSLTNSTQGALPLSTLANQRQTIVGARARFHPRKGYDATIDLGRAWYDAGLVTRPGTAQPGNYEHVSLARHLGNDLATIEYFRFDPRYATVILPYGIAENVWSVAWSWPGPWLKSTYQLVDNSAVGINRAGFRFRYDLNGKRLEAHIRYSAFAQIVPETLGNATQVGFVDGFFLPQANGFATRGTDRQLALYAAWHLAHDDLAFDGVEDFLHRDAAPGHPIDGVDIRAPQIVLSLQHHFSKRLLAVLGYGRYEADGGWAGTPVDATWGVGFAGVQFATGPETALLVEARRYGLIGVPSAPGGLPPTMKGTALVVDQRVGL